MFSVTIRGFKTLEAAQEFRDWYEGQGEQDIGAWWEINGEGDQPTTDSSKPAKETKKGVEFWVRN